MTIARGDRAALVERLLSIMDQKNHWAWPKLTKPGLSRAALAAHFRHEYRTYVRDFPVLLARVLGQGPPDEARIALAENLYEEQTGKLSLGVPHPALFLEMIDGLGIDRASIEDPSIPLEPEALTYRAMLDRVSASPPWQIGAAVLTIFVEGSVHERAELEGSRKLPPIDEVIRTHPMVQHYGCPPERMRLARAHRAVEGGHRRDAWTMLLAHVAPESDLAASVVDAMSEALTLWQAYRSAVARHLG